MTTTMLASGRNLIALACLLLPFAARAGSNIVRDNSLGSGPTAPLPGLGTISANGFTYTRIPIPESYGSRAGTNVFHSFSAFDIGSGDAAVFYVGAPTSNIISRVTGGQPSRIAGLISVDAGTTGSRPNVYLINPAGVAFSAGAAIDVPAAFHVSTADVITFADGRFESDPARASTLSTAAPAAFGFLGTRSAAVSVSGALLQNAASIGVAAGDITISGAGLVAINGDIRLAATGAQAVNVPLSGKLPTGLKGVVSLSGNASALTYSGNALSSGEVRVSAGEVRLGDGTGSTALMGSVTGPASTGSAGGVELDVSGAFVVDPTSSLLSNIAGAGAGGDVRVRAGSVQVNGTGDYSGVYTSGTASSAGQVGSVNIMATGPVSINSGGQVYSSSSGTGNTGAVSISGNSVSVGADGINAWIYTEHYGAGSAGAIDIAASGAVSVQAGSTIRAIGGSAGDSGSIAIKGNTITVEGQAGLPVSISTTSVSNGGGDRGAISFDAAGLLSMPGEVGVATFASGAGNGGYIRMTGGDIVLGGPAGNVAIVAGSLAGATGQAGDIDIVSRGQLALRNGAVVTTSTKGASNSGSLRISADTMTLESGDKVTGIFSDSLGSSSGAAGDISVVVKGRLSIFSDSTISSSTRGSGNAGNVRVEAGSILMDGRNGGVNPSGDLTGIVSNAAPGSSGNAGAITVHAFGDLTMRDFGEISTSAQGSGKAGAITVDATTIALDYAQMAALADVNSAGQVGNMLVRASDSISLRNSSYLNLQNYASLADPSTVTPGTVYVSAPVILLDGSYISSIATGNVPAGRVTVKTGERLILQNASAIATAAHDANGGPVTIDGGKLVSLKGSTVTTSVLGQQGNGGDIDLRADVLLLDSGMIKANTSAQDSSGGDVQIHTRALITSGSSLIVGGSVRYPFEPNVFGFNVIQAAAPNGVSGDVSLSTPALDIAGVLAALSIPHIDDGGLGRNPCQSGGSSTLVLTGRGAMPPSARDLLGVLEAAPVTLGQRNRPCDKG